MNYQNLAQEGNHHIYKIKNKLLDEIYKVGSPCRGLLIEKELFLFVFDFDPLQSLVSDF